MLESLKFPKVDIASQRAIASTLIALDDKIELNRQMNETLEATARALFRDWFVDFGPTKAKMAGDAPYLAPDLWALFPEKVDEEGLPDSWKKYCVGDLVDQHTKSIKPTDKADEIFEHFSLPAYDKGQVPVREIGAGIKSSKVVVPREAILLSKLNPETNRVWWPGSSEGLRQIASTEFLAMVPKHGFSRSLVYALFRDRNFRLKMQGLVTGTSKSHQRIQPKSLKQLDALTGNEYVFSAFNVLVSPMFEKILANREEAIILAQTRDLLLPKLMSGEIRIRDAEEAVSEIA